MLTIGTVPLLLKIVGKLDVKPLISAAKNADIFADVEGKEAALNELSKEKLGLLAFEIIGELTPQLGKIADDIPPLVAAYKGVSTDEANKLDAAEVIDEIIHDEGIVNFFAKALRRKAGQEASPSYTPIMTGA